MLMYGWSWTLLHGKPVLKVHPPGGSICIACLWLCYGPNVVPSPTPPQIDTLALNPNVVVLHWGLEKVIRSCGWD